MTPYENMSGDSGVVAYEIAADSIDVRFRDGATYLYTYRSAGAGRVEQMKALASSGRGLSAYIARHVRDAYELKRP